MRELLKEARENAELKARIVDLRKSQEDQFMKAEAERDRMLEWESRCAIALGVPGCHPEEMLNVIDGLMEAARKP